MYVWLNLIVVLCNLILGIDQALDPPGSLRAGVLNVSCLFTIYCVLVLFICRIHVLLPLCLGY